MYRTKPDELGLLVEARDLVADGPEGRTETDSTPQLARKRYIWEVSFFSHTIQSDDHMLGTYPLKRRITLRPAAPSVQLFVSVFYGNEDQTLWDHAYEIVVTYADAERQFQEAEAAVDAMYGGDGTHHYPDAVSWRLSHEFSAIYRRVQLTPPLTRYRARTDNVYTCELTVVPNVDGVYPKMLRKYFDARAWQRHVPILRDYYDTELEYTEVRVQQTTHKINQLKRKLSAAEADLAADLRKKKLFRASRKALYEQSQNSFDLYAGVRHDELSKDAESLRDESGSQSQDASGIESWSVSASEGEGQRESESEIQSESSSEGASASESASTSARARAGHF